MACYENEVEAYGVPVRGGVFEKWANVVPYN
jgi:hypothetical protein